MTATLIFDGRIVTPAGVLAKGWIRLRDGRIIAVEAGEPPDPLAHEERVAAAGRWLLPGMIDIHVHGGGGASLMSHDPDEVTRAVAFHRAHGTTRLLASLVTAPIPQLLHSVAQLAELADDEIIAGTHLEGPFLAPEHRGAQDPRFMLAPDAGTLDRLLRAGRGSIKVVTLAPELPGAIDLIPRILDGGALPAIGHTGATYEQAIAAIDAGARIATHLFNGMRPVHHLEPGVVIASIDRPEITCELISDGVHVHPAVVAHVVRAAGPPRVAMITDAIAAAGMPDGRYELGSMPVEVRGGVARLAGGDSLAGSTLTMAGALRRAVCELGLSVEEAAKAVASTAARALGLERRAGAIVPGADADLLVCEHDMTLVRVMAGGRWVDVPAT
jgi:N-acetylglucosamine-6-phosphate deacetylase